MKATASRLVVPPAAQSDWLRAREAQVDGRVFEVTAAARGRVDEILVAANEMVERRQPLVTLDTGDLDREVEKAAGTLAHAVAATAARQKILPRLGAGQSPAVAQARAQYVLARLHRYNAEIRSPAKGRVLTTRVRPGDLVAAGQPLLSLLHADELWAMAMFEPSEFAGLRMGQRARVSMGAGHFDARVAGFVTADDPVLLEFDVRPPLSLRPGTRVAAIVRRSQPARHPRFRLTGE
jgi:multidrug resistance efflux pump